MALTPQVGTLFATIAEEAMMGIMVFEPPKNHCVYINKLAREILQFPETKDSAEITLTDLYPKKTFTDYRAFSADLLQHEGLYQDIVISKVNNANFMANLGVRKFQFDNEELILVMFQDITFQKKLQKEIALKQQEIKKAYEELLAQNKQLKELDLAKNKFIALTTHELRTPVAAVVATADILVNKLYDNEEQKEEFIKTMHEQGNHLLALVNDILDFAKIQAGKMEYFVEKGNVTEVIKEQISHFEPWANKEFVTLEFTGSSGPWECYFDKLRLSQVIGNIINNAIKFNKKNGGVNLSVNVNDSKDFTIITIADTGRGIEASKLDKVFNEFETVTDVSKHHKGTGLGMPISKRIIESMGGKIGIESRFGVGTSFTIFVPNLKVLPDEVYRSRPDTGGDLAA